MKVIIQQPDAPPPTIQPAAQINPTDLVTINQAGVSRTATVQQLINATNSINLGLTASGTNQATALPLTAAFNVLSTVAAGSCAILTHVLGNKVTVLVTGANPLTLYPGDGEQIGTLGVNDPATVEPNSPSTFVFDGVSQWTGF